jgi:hypothetical protein
LPGIIKSDAVLLLSTADAYRDIGVPLWSGWAAEEAAALLAETGEAKRAREALADAVRVYADLDSTWDRRRTEARPHGLDIRLGPRSLGRRPATGWPALTRTEITVARLVTTGMSNAAIAADLHPSRSVDRRLADRASVDAHHDRTAANSPGRARA